MASSNPTPEELDRMKKSEIVAFLKSRKKRCTGNRPELLQYAKSVIEEVDMSLDETILDSLVEKRSVFELQTLKWASYESLKSSEIPEKFDITTVTNFLTNILMDFGDEEIDTGTEKPAQKGRKMYTSKKIQFVEFCIHENLLMFRANIEASMKGNLFR